MPQRKAGVKHLRKSHSQKLHNLDIKTTLRKTIKHMRALLQKKSIEEAKVHLKTVYKKLDKAAKRNIIAKNTASRQKSQMAKLLAKPS